MDNICLTLLGFLLTLDQTYKQYILTHIRPEFFAEECYKEIFLALSALIAEERVVDILALKDRIITDEDPRMLEKRMQVFRRYFYEKGELGKDSTEDELLKSIISLLATILSKVDYSIPAEKVVQAFLQDYVARTKQSLIAEYQILVKSNPFGDYTGIFIEKMKELDALVSSDYWSKFVVDLNALAKEEEESAILFRKGNGIFWRQNLYVVAGNPGSMKSLFCLCLAAAASNMGIGADRTLSFHGLSVPLKIVYADTQLGHNTLQKRAPLVLRMLKQYHQEGFTYLWLRKVKGGVEEKKRVLAEACRSIKADLIIIDSARDLCKDYNDNNEADRLVEYLNQLAMELNAAIISTSHISIATGNSKGHLGVRMNEMADMVFVLEKQKEDGKGTIINVKFPKEREEENSNFSFRMNPESGLLEECTPTVDYTDERLKFRKAEERVREVLHCGEVVRYSELKKRIMGYNGSRVSERTAKDYISVLIGTVIVKKTNGYSLSGSQEELPLKDETDEDMPPA